MSENIRIFHGRKYYRVRSVTSGTMPTYIMASTVTSIIEVTFYDSQYVLTEWVEQK